MISLRREAWVHKTILTLPLFIEVLIPIQKRELLCICVLGPINFASSGAGTAYPYGGPEFTPIF